MSPRTGRPTVNKKTKRLEIRLTPEEFELLDECSKILAINKTNVINKGVRLVKDEIDRLK